jgi:transcriptional regulator with XRE-family HTH domain
VDKTHYDIFLKELGKQIRRIRKDKGLSMEALAYKTEIEYRQLGRIERGEGNSTVISLMRIAYALQVDIKELFSFDLPS